MASLLRDWSLLEERVVPGLLSVASRPLRAWSIGSEADAVAVAVAFAAQGGHHEDLQVFCSGSPAGAGASFAHSDLGSVPASGRARWFRRREHRWVPDVTIAEQVVLGVPPEPVDLLTVRTGGAGGTGEVPAEALDRVRDGGQVLLADRPARRPGRLRQAGADGRLFYKTRETDRPRPRARRPARDQPHQTLADRERQDQLVASHTNLARSLARRFAQRGQPPEELEQVAMLALVMASSRFDPSRETAFGAYATATVLGEIKRHFRDRTWSVRVPRSLQELHLSVSRAREELAQQLGGAPTIPEVAAHLGLTEEDVVEAMEVATSYRAASLEARAPDDEPAHDVAVVDPAFEQALDRHRLQAVLPRLDGRERLILTRVFFDGQTQQAVAGELGISQMHVSRLLARALVKLRR